MAARTPGVEKYVHVWAPGFHSASFFRGFLSYHARQTKAPTKRSRHLNTTDRNIVDATCCVCLATLLRLVGCYLLRFEDGPIFHATFVVA